jgi:hypothetical protein
MARQFLLLLIGIEMLVVGLLVIPLPPLLLALVFVLGLLPVVSLGYLAYEDRVLGRDTDTGGAAVSAIVWLWFLASWALGGIYTAFAAEPFLWRGVAVGFALVSDLFGVLAIWAILHVLLGGPRQTAVRR